MAKLVAAMVVTACSERHSPEALLDNYHYRMSNIVGDDIALDTPMDPPAYPGKRQLAVPLPAVQVDLLEYLRLSPCDLQRLIGRRNSSLGRVMQSSQRLIYEMEFIQLADPCLELLRDTDADAELRRKLERAVAEKRSHVPAAAWNATFAGEEFEQLFSLATAALDTQGIASRPSVLLESMGQLQNRLGPLSEARPISVEGIEGELAVIGAEKYGGRLLRSLVLTESYLRAINQAMAARADSGPLCFERRPNPRAEVWRNVFYKYYIGQVQPYLSVLHQRARGLAEVVEPLLGTLSPLSDSLHPYWQSSFSRDSDSSVLRRFEQALSHHIRLWQDVLSQCGMMPGSGEEAQRSS